MQIFIEITEHKNRRSLSFLSLEIEYKIYFKTDPVTGVRIIINQSVGIVLDPQIPCCLSGIKFVFGGYILFFSGLCDEAVF